MSPRGIGRTDGDTCRFAEETSEDAKCAGLIVAGGLMDRCASRGGTGDN